MDDRQSSVSLPEGFDGAMEGFPLGIVDGLSDGLKSGVEDGLTEGIVDQVNDGVADGAADGIMVGANKQSPPSKLHSVVFMKLLRSSPKMNTSQKPSPIQQEFSIAQFE